MKFESDWAKTVSCAAQGFAGGVPNLTLTPNPVTKKRIGFLLSSSTNKITVWKWSGENCSLYQGNDVSQAEWQSWPWPLILQPKINRVTLLIMPKLHMKFESDWAKTAIYIVSTRFYTQSANVDLWPRNPTSIEFLLLSSSTTACEVWVKNCSPYCAHNVKYTECQIWPWPLTPQPKINRVPPRTIQNLHLKFVSYWTNTAVCIVPKRCYTRLIDRVPRLTFDPVTQNQ